MRNVVINTSLVCVFIMVISLFFVNSGFAKIDTSTIAGLWLFDEGKGDVVADLSGNGNDGAIKGNSAKWIKGKFGSALEFSGNEYVEVPDSDSLDMNKQLTVLFWFKTSKKMADMWADRQVVVGKHYLEYEVGIYMQGQIHTYTNDGTGANYDEGIMASMAGKLPDGDAEWELNKWYHVAWTLNKTQEIACVNGVKIGEYNKAHEGTKPGVNTLEIGRRQAGGQPLTGAVDEVLVLNTVLGEDEIMTLATNGYKGGLSVTQKGKLITTWASIKR